MFIKHVLGMDTEHPNLFGDTSAYYSTIEQQDQLTLLLHILIWISRTFSPEEMRKRILDSLSEFQKKLIKYLERVHIREFITGKMEDIVTAINAAKDHNEYINPTLELPLPSPDKCKSKCGECSDCGAIKSWWLYFELTVYHIKHP